MSSLESIAPMVQSSGQQVYRLPSGQVRPEADVAGHVREPAVEGDGVRPGVAAEQPHAAGVHPQQAEQHARGGGLAGALIMRSATIKWPWDPPLSRFSTTRAPSRTAAARTA